MGRVEDGEPLHPVRMPRGRPPGDDAAPVVADQGHPLAPERVGEADHVGDEGVKTVSPNTLGLAAAMVASPVGSGDAEARGRQRPDLPAPAEGELGEAVQEDDERAVLRAVLDDVQRDVVDGDPPSGRERVARFRGVRSGVHGRAPSDEPP
jgi:hypothetical protein